MIFYDWLTVVTVGFLAVIIPGPNMAVVVRNSLTHTRHFDAMPQSKSTRLSRCQFLSGFA